ncbi:hypothetical protein CEXT_765041 [Caerostris extrusa]|uniref:Uncharacterized protein n=1 Tax=Caerostris extrusa TaxID=172846 RepID=A0AAV4SD61_CAEEX|nr:hypothetical protein CEXT_765041 [Caerostris extrusa]
MNLTVDMTFKSSKYSFGCGAFQGIPTNSEVKELPIRAPSYSHMSEYESGDLGVPELPKEKEDREKDFSVVTWTSSTINSLEVTLNLFWMILMRRLEERMNFHHWKP